MVFAQGSPWTPDEELGLWLYRFGTNELRRLTAQGEEATPRNPRFVARDRIAFLADGQLNVLDLSTGVRSRISLPHGALAYAWHPTDGRIAYVATRPIKPSGAGPHDIFLFDPVTRESTLIRRFAGPRGGQGTGGRELVTDDENTLAWSPDGSHLLLVDTLVDLPVKNTLYVFEEDGSPAVHPQRGTHGVWSPDSRFVYFRRWDPPRSLDMPQEPDRVSWRRLNVANGDVQRLRIRHGRMHPNVSPDGAMLVFDDARQWLPSTRRPSCQCSLYTYDLETMQEKFLARGYAAPIWVDVDNVIATEVRACVRDECGITPSRSALIAVEDGSADTIPPYSTVHASFQT